MVTGHADVPRGTLINLSMHRRSICQKRFIFQPARPTFPRSAFLPYSRPSKNNGTKCSMLDGREKKECIGGNCRFEQTSASWLSPRALRANSKKRHGAVWVSQMVWFVGEATSLVKTWMIILFFYYFFFFFRWKISLKDVAERSNFTIKNFNRKSFIKFAYLYL